jgi:8-oxo-dGTP pyrophosphatase MutT (NUDIX family)
MPDATVPHPPDATVNLRCSVVIARDDSVLVIERTPGPEWTLPGGRPRDGESVVACARRETLEETGLVVDVGRCLFVLEVAEARSQRLLELVFAASLLDHRRDPIPTEPGRRPTFVPLATLAGLQLRPPLAGHLRGLGRHHDTGAPFLGNLWRPPSGADTSVTGANQ